MLVALVLAFCAAACATTDTDDTNGAGGDAASASATGKEYTSASACVDACQASDHPNCVGICNSSATMCAVSTPGLQ